MKEDILEQLVEDWFIARPGWFVKHNIRYRPSKNHPDYHPKQDSVHSDIDLLATSKIAGGAAGVCAVTCKSWQGGFRYADWLEVLEADATYNRRSAAFQRREQWKYFRELVSDKWMAAFLDTIERETGSRQFTYIIAVARAIGTDDERTQFEQSRIIQNRFEKKKSKCCLRILTLKEMVADFARRLGEKETPVLEATEIGRLLQLVYAADLRVVPTSGDKPFASDTSAKQRGAQ